MQHTQGMMWEARWGRRGPEGAADLLWTERGVDLRGHLGAGLEGFREEAFVLEDAPPLLRQVPAFGYSV